MKVKAKVKLLSHVRFSATPWTEAYQAPPFMGFSRQEYWSGLPLPSPYTLKTKGDYVSSTFGYWRLHTFSPSVSILKKMLGMAGKCTKMVHLRSSDPRMGFFSGLLSFASDHQKQQQFSYLFTSKLF